MRFMGQSKIEKMVGTPKKENEKALSDEMEKGDIPAIIIAALITLWPAIAISIALLLFIYWLIVR